VAKSNRKQKLKVYRTPIGFHDAYVAAPSQKAALEAWGTATNLFARGAAELVTDEALTEVPLENPGQVVKVLRGTKKEQLAALAKQKPPKRTETPKPEIVPKRAKKRVPKPNRAALAKAEEVLEKLEKRHEKQRSEIEEQERALERKRRDMQRRHERERDEAEERVESEQEKYQEAVELYESG
jgi:hypothetical protein